MTEFAVMQSNSFFLRLLLPSLNQNFKLVFFLLFLSFFYSHNDIDVRVGFYINTIYLCLYVLATNMTEIAEMQLNSFIIWLL